jgi:hypothetical protein
MPSTSKVNNSWLFSPIWQSRRRGSTDCVAAGQVWQHGRRDMRSARHCGRQDSRVGVIVQTAWQQGWHGNMAGATHGQQGGWQDSGVGMAVRTAWQRGLRGNMVSATCGRQGTVVGKAAGSAWQRRLRGSRAGVATQPARHGASEAPWLTRQQDWCGTKVGES